MSLSDLESVFMEHMEGQPYQIICTECGEDLTVTTEVDRDGDLKLKVGICKFCVKIAEAKK